MTPNFTQFQIERTESQTKKHIETSTVNQYGRKINETK